MPWKCNKLIVYVIYLYIDRYNKFM